MHHDLIKMILALRSSVTSTIIAYVLKFTTNDQARPATELYRAYGNQQNTRILDCRALSDALL